MALVIVNSISQLKRLSKAIQDREGMHKAIANSVSEEVRDLLAVVSNNQKENKFGKGHTFWKRMIRSVKPLFTSSAAIVEMNRAIALRYFGGIVRPTGGKKFLTIPVNKAAYGKAAGFFPGMFVVRFAGDGKNGRAFLAIQEKSDLGIGPGKKDKLTLMYLLLRFTKHKPDVSILPNRNRLKRVVKNAIATYLNSKVQ